MFVYQLLKLYGKYGYNSIKVFGANLFNQFPADIKIVKSENELPWLHSAW